MLTDSAASSSLSTHRVPARREFLLRMLASVIALPIVFSINTLHASESRIEYPERTVREFLKLHFESTRVFSARGLDKKERWFTRRFRQGLYKFFEFMSKSNRTVPLVLDPFTGSQGATRYTVAKGRVRGEKATVPVQFSDGSNEWTITYHLRDDQERNDDRWRIDDIEDVRGMKLSEVLKKQQQ